MSLFKQQNFSKASFKFLKPMNRAMILMFTLLAAFALTTSAYAQEEEVIELEEINTLEYDALMIKLQTTFSIELQVLEDYVAAGYSPGQLWLALEIARERNIVLDEALVLAEGSDGHGWGVLAQKLGIDPGSSEFHALKARWTERKGVMLGELKREGEGGAKPDTPANPDAPKGSSNSGKPDSPGNAPGSKGKNSGGSSGQSSGGNSNSSGQGGKR